jgi:hypothetical protein
MIVSSRHAEPIQGGMFVREARGKASNTLNFPPARCQNGVVATAGPGPEGRGEEIIVASWPMTLYDLHRCTFALRLRDGIQPT